MDVSEGIWAITGKEYLWREEYSQQNYQNCFNEAVLFVQLFTHKLLSL